MNKINLETFAGGALSERFSMAYQEVLENIMDPNTEFKKKKKINFRAKLHGNRRQGVERGGYLNKDKTSAKRTNVNQNTN